MWSVLNNFILTATSKPKPVHPQQDIQRCKNKCWKFRVLRAHFWPCHVSWKAATGCRTCARPGKRIGPVLSSSPSVWTSECRSAWCTYTSPLQESTRRHFIYQEPSHDIVIFCCQHQRELVQIKYLVYCMWNVACWSLSLSFFLVFLFHTYYYCKCTYLLRQFVMYDILQYLCWDCVQENIMTTPKESLKQLRQVEVYHQALVYEIIGCVTQGFK